MNHYEKRLYIILTVIHWFGIAMKFVKQKKTHTGHEKYQFRIEGFIGDTEFSNMLKFLTESFGPSSIYPLLKTFPQPGNESWTWLHRISQKTSDRYILIKDETILSVLLFKYPQLTT